VTFDVALRRNLPIAMCGLILSTSPTIAQDEESQGLHDWPRWRGPNADGVSPETGWSSRGRTEDTWRARVGMGYTSASVANGRLYTVGFTTPTSEDTIACLDAESGAPIWSFSYPAELMDQDHTGGTLSTPTVDGDRVYVSTRDGHLRCLDAALGTVIWHVDVAQTHGATPGIYGFGGSPLIVGDVLFINQGKTYAINKNTGELIWTGESEGIEFSTPAPFTLNGRACLATFGKEGLEVLARDSGETLFDYPWKIGRGAVNASTPIPVGEKIFISSAYNHGCALIEFAEDGANEVWANKRMRNKMAGCVLVNDRFFGFDESVLKCLDAEGREVWRKRGLGNGSLIAGDSRLIIMSSKGELVIADATTESYVELSRARIFEEGTFWSPPVLANGLIYARSSLGELVCRDHRSTDALIATDDAIDSLPEAEALFAGHLELIGGEANLRRHDTRHVKGQFEMRSVGFGAVPFEIDRRAPDLWHAKIKSPGGRPGHIERFFNGEIAYELNPHPSYGNRLLEPEIRQELSHTSDLYDEANFASKFTSMKTLGIETFDDRECYVVEAITEGGTTRHVYFDRRSGLIAGRSGETESIATFDDYREFGGLLIPTLRRYYVQDTGIEETYRVESVTFDDVDESIWDLPDSIRELSRNTD
jgi:outer membrane protein assembly factor BamB